jgi:hypothetical protein
VDESGRRCSERDRLEYHHRHPFGVGGDHSPNNISLMCRAHNTDAAEHDYGRQTMARWASARSLPPRQRWTHHLCRGHAGGGQSLTEARHARRAAATSSRHD